MTRYAYLIVLLLCACKDDAKPPPTTATPAPAPAAQQEGKASPPKAPTAERPTKAQQDAERRTFTFQLEQLNRDLDGLIKVSEKNKSVLAMGRVAEAYMTRARLTGSYADYSKAEGSLKQAFALKEGYGPWLLRARLNYTLHRMDRVDDDVELALNAPVSSAAGRANLVAFRANIAFQRGQYETAAKLYTESLELDRTISNLSSAAVHAWKTADFETAEKYFREALAKYHAKPTEPIAWLHLNLGLLDLDRGRYDDALAHYQEAASYIEGYWLIDEHIAEILTLQGKTEEAKKLYLDILERTNNPEFMDAMAGILSEEKKEQEAKEYVERANNRYEEQLAQYPEAAYGHALGHYLEFGEEPSFTLELAKKNFKLRPNAEAATLLAEAHLKAGDQEAAIEAVELMLASPHRTADALVTASTAYSAIGDTTRAEKLLAEARAINPLAGSGD